MYIMVRADQKTKNSLLPMFRSHSLLFDSRSCVSLLCFFFIFFFYQACVDVDENLLKQKIPEFFEVPLCAIRYYESGRLLEITPPLAQPVYTSGGNVQYPSTLDPSAPGTLPHGEKFEFFFIFIFFGKLKLFKFLPDSFSLSFFFNSLILFSASVVVESFCTHLSLFHFLLFFFFLFFFFPHFSSHIFLYANNNNNNNNNNNRYHGYLSFSIQIKSTI